MTDMPHAMMLPPRSGDATREAYWGELQTFLEAEVRPGFRAHYRDVVAPALAADPGRTLDWRGIAAAMRRYGPNRAWYVARTEAQRQAFDASRVIVDGQVDALAERAAALGNGPATLEIDPALPFPDYVQQDAHNMTGGYEDHGQHHPLAAGATYDRALSIHRVAAMGPLVDDVGHSIAARLTQAFPDFAPRRILELGCTVGHTLLPFKAAFPDADVVGVDVSGPCLAFGAARASALETAVTFSQRNAEHTGYPDESVDLVFSRILLHETCEAATRAVFAECHRLLRPGGIMFHSDAPPFDELDPYDQSLRDWDIHFNAEPFMAGYYAMNLEEEFDRAGFRRDAMFRLYAPSLIVQRGYRAEQTRTRGGRYFLAGARK
ncbi:class I SAM-dependent methyltransferase [Sphingomonas solaris]|uniref:Methyltransferase domain-containing protein n=1 Tax=Alterirhizorhabdus solaris TaxID=2529389 RepID=A0A558RB83_9SPHN|nr:class I SAM-dependent methyltransferase [Sphingomonas solaris]TVV76532.1 methyltransferase domain-containing protein [Sphingomonas solaris]